MAQPLNWIVNTSQKAAEVYAGLIEAGDMDSKMWDFDGIRRDHEQIVGDVRRTFAEIGEEPVEKSRRIWPDLKKSHARRLYEDVETLRALRDAEKAELEDCRELLSMEEDGRLVNSFVSNEVVPVLESHIDTLDRYLHRAESHIGQGLP